MNWRVLAAVGLVVVGVGAVGLSVFGPTLARSNTTQYLTAAASVADVTDQAVADGAISAETTYGLAFGVDPHVVSASSSSSAGAGAWLVDSANVIVGQHVSATDILATADTRDAQSALDLAQAGLDSAQARYDADTGGVNSTDQQAAQLAIDQANQNLAGAKQSRDETITENKLRVSQAEADVSRAQTQLSDDRAANAPDAVITGDKDALRQARDSLSLLRVQVDAQNRQANDQVDGAQLALDSANNDYASRTATASDVVIASDHAALLQAQQSVVNAQTQIDDATLRAPVDGVVVAVDLVVGTTAPSADAIQLMGDKMQVAADFAEADLPNLATGQQATVTVTATGDVVSGQVSEISPIAATSGASSVVSYTVTIALGDLPEGIRPGMSAQVAVIIAQAKNVVAVPATALQGSSGNYTVRILNADGTATVRPVQVGLVTSSLAEIKSGVAEGDQVITGTASQSSSATTSSTNFGGGGGGFPGGGPRQFVTTP